MKTTSAVAKDDGPCCGNFSYIRMPILHYNYYVVVFSNVRLHCNVIYLLTN